MINTDIFNDLETMINTQDKANFTTTKQERKDDQEKFKKYETEFNNAKTLEEAKQIGWYKLYPLFIKAGYSAIKARSRGFFCQNIDEKVEKAALNTLSRYIKKWPDYTFSTLTTLMYYDILNVFYDKSEAFYSYEEIADKISKYEDKNGYFDYYGLIKELEEDESNISRD